jgi:endonuclease/exonuclease/phosphatase family metal-dependent hydrolase
VLILSDGHEAVLCSKQQVGLGPDDHPSGPELRAIFRTPGSPRRLLSAWVRDSDQPTSQRATPSGAVTQAVAEQPSELASAGRTRIVTYNLRRGGSPRHLEAVLSSSGATVLLLQETQNPEELLHSVGDRSWQVYWRQVPGVEWGTAVVSAIPLSRTFDIPGFEGWVVGAEFDPSPLLPAERVVTISVHAPSRAKAQGRTDYVREVNHLLDRIEPLVQGATLLLGGDFNFRSLGARLPTESLRTAPDEERVLARLRSEFRLVSGWQLAHPGCPLPQTLRWNGGPTTPYHCDGLFLPLSWSSALAACEVLDGAGWAALSDHNPVVMALS